ncbi:MAG: TfoX/Sxy family protein [Burkholderiales bacterium]
MPTKVEKSRSGKSADGAGKAPSLASLPNLGPKSAGYLRSAGIRTHADLERLESIAAYAKVKRVEPKASLNLLWAIEGALTGLHWREVTRKHRTSLLLALETHEDQIRSNSSK